MKKRTRASANAITSAAAFSFLRDMRGRESWGVKELTAVLKIAKNEADDVLAILAAQGYVQHDTKSGRWFTTTAGNSVAGSSEPRFLREAVARAVTELKKHIKAMNAARTETKVVRAVAIGDFLLQEPRVQAAEVGLELAQATSKMSISSKMVFAKLRNKSQHIRLRPYEPWMSKRSHLNLIG